MAELSFNFIPLTFINDNSELKKQIRNTLILRSVFDQYNKVELLGNVLKKTQYGYTASAKLEGNCKLLRITDIKGTGIDWTSVPYCDCANLDNYKIFKNDILIARTGGTTGKSYFVGDIEEDVVFASYLIRLTPSQNVNPNYIYMFLNSYLFWGQIIQIKGGTAQPNVNAEKLKNVLLPICPKDIQSEIVNYITTNKKNSSYIDNIEKKINKVFGVIDNQNLLLQNIEHQQALLKQLRQTILQEAVEGKLTAEWRTQNPELISGENHAERLLEKIKAEKERLVKDGKIKKQKELPPIRKDEKPFELPEGWVWCRLGEIINKLSTGPFGTMLHKSDYVPNGIPLVNPMNIVANKIIPNQKMMVNESTKKRLYRYILELNAIVLSRRGDLSKCAIVTENEKGWLCGTGSFFIKIPDLFDKHYFIQVFISNYFQKELLGNSIGQTMSNLNQSVLVKALFAMPPFEEQKAIVEKVDHLMAKIDALEEQVKSRKEQAEQLMQAVLREAFTENNIQGETING